MKRPAMVFGILCAAALTGCDKLDASHQSAPMNATTVEGKVRNRPAGGEAMRVWRDPLTGCQYLLWERRRTGSMTPRLKTDGRPMCD